MKTKLLLKNSQICANECVVYHFIELNLFRWYVSHIGVNIYSYTGKSHTERTNALVHCISAVLMNHSAINIFQFAYRYTHVCSLQISQQISMNLYHVIFRIHLLSPLWVMVCQILKCTQFDFASLQKGRVINYFFCCFVISIFITEDFY